MKRLILGLATILIAIPTYTAVMAHLDFVTPPKPAMPNAQADLIYIDKSERRMDLRREGQVIASYQISLGANADAGHKQREGDERTPEGLYLIDWRNSGSFAYLSLHISYPNEQDKAVATKLGYDPGGLIMIHGIANGWGWLGKLHRLWDWTNGCIAVTNIEMREIWSLVPNGTPIRVKA